ncbi:MAG: SGNH/GDSL hydrolase family protein [Bacilli bacterium]|jgi:lysophospholipase L1-like esterase|nr:SGNH/GDSL hydrolase family protein [Bacilli bacterium]
MEIKGKSIYFLGDSITEGYGPKKREDSFVEIIKRKNLFKIVKNYGVGGTRLARQNEVSDYAVWDYDFLLRTELMDEKADIICVFGGTNDYGHGTAPFGKEGDKDPYTFCGAVNLLIQTLKKKYPHSKIFFITPSYRYDADNVKAVTHLKPYKPLKDYVDVIKKLCAENSIPYLDLYDDSLLSEKNKATASQYLADGLHPNEKGSAYLADLILDFIKKSL